MPKGIYKHKNPSLETKNKMSMSHIGKFLSIESKKKLSLSKIGNKGGIGNKGKIHSPEIILKQKLSHIGCNVTHGLSRTKEYKAIHSQNRRARLEKVGGSFTISEWNNLKAQYNWTCPRCHKSEPDIKLTIDHIIPVVKGGSNNIENIQPLCGSCNSIKGTKIVVFKLE